MHRRLVAMNLQYFDAIRRAGSFREASRQLHVASSALTRQIMKLEDSIGAPLFERRAKGLQLTPAGEALARHATTVIQDADRAVHELQGVVGGSRGSVSIAAVEGVISDPLPTVITRMLARSPLLKITAMVAGSDAVGSIIGGGDADIGLGFALKRDPNLKQRSVGRFAIGAVMTPDHPLATQLKLRLSDCISYPIVMAGDQLSIRKMMEPHLRRVQTAPIIAVESNSLELLKTLAARGLGIAFQTQIGLEREIANKTLVHIPLAAQGPILSELGLYVRMDRALPLAVEGMVRAISEEIALREDTEQLQS
jgi:DNA-binding transcriptional LysR family regulator